MPTPSPTPTCSDCGVGGGGGTGGLFDQLAQLIGAIIGLIINAVQLALKFIESIIPLFNNIVTQWNNATITPIPGTSLPHCATDPLANQVCAIYWLLTYTLFSGQIGVLLIPAGQAAVWLVTIFTIIKQARNILDKLKEIISG